MSNAQTCVQPLQWIIRHLQCEIQALRDIIYQLSQEEDPNLIIIEAEPIFDNNEPIPFELPSALLQQEIEVDIQHPTLENTSQIAVTNTPTHPQVLT